MNDDDEDGECWQCLQPFVWEHCPKCGGDGTDGNGEEPCMECNGKGEVLMCDCYRNALNAPGYWLS